MTIGIANKITQLSTGLAYSITNKKGIINNEKIHNENKSLCFFNFIINGRKINQTKTQELTGYNDHVSESLRIKSIKTHTKIAVKNIIDIIDSINLGCIYK